MAAPLRVRLDQAARDELDRRYQTTRDATTRTRYQMVLLRAEGHPVVEAAQLPRGAPPRAPPQVGSRPAGAPPVVEGAPVARCSPDTVRRVLKRYLTGRPD